MSELVGICEVARDLVELDRVDEAKALLDEQAPERHRDWCGACGAAPKSPCHERGMRPCRFCGGSGERRVVRIGPGEPREWIERCHDCFGTGEREVDVDMIVPHESRLIGLRPRWAR